MTSAICRSLFAEQVVIDYDFDPVGGGLGSKGAGQTFTPRDAVEGAEPDTLALTEFTMFRGSGGTGESQVSSTVYLVIYDGDPGTAPQVGVSILSISNTTMRAEPNTRGRLTSSSLIRRQSIGR